MPVSRLCICSALAIACTTLARSQQPEAAQIMARVAAHQDQAEAERAHYVYVQHTKMSSRKGKTPMCEETTDYRITPLADSSHRELVQLQGRLLVRNKYVAYDRLLPDEDDARKQQEADKASASQSPATARTDESPAAPNSRDGAKPPDDEKQNPSPATAEAEKHDAGPDGLDRQLVENMRGGLLSEKSKDGIGAHLFPLTTKEQAEDTFELAGRERLNGRDVFHIKFRPKDRKDFGWQGDAYIDATAYQPVLVTTAMSRKIPFAVRTLMGIDVPGLGFTVTYAPQPDGPWFPVTFSTEFKIEVLFFFHRQIILDASNRDFQKTHGDTRILEGVTPVQDGAAPLQDGATPVEDGVKPGRP
jgi:hypothetical protein